MIHFNFCGRVQAVDLHITYWLDFKKRVFFVQNILGKQTVVPEWDNRTIPHHLSTALPRAFHDSIKDLARVAGFGLESCVRHCWDAASGGLYDTVHGCFTYIAEVQKTAFVDFVSM